jgi:hypothetical protein
MMASLRRCRRCNAVKMLRELTNELVPVVIEEMIELGRVGEEWRVQREQL